MTKLSVIYLAKLAPGCVRAARFPQEVAEDAPGRHRDRPNALRASQRGREISKPKMTSGTGNVFAVLGFAPEEASLLQMRVDLMNELQRVVAARGWTQVVAARELGVGQSRISDLVRGKWQQFSLDRLVTLAVRAGLRVSVDLAAA